MEILEKNNKINSKINSEEKIQEKIPYIVLKDVSYKYPKGNFQIDNIDITLMSGEIVFLIGRNGSGKTTISKLASGILKPIKGQVLIDGKDSKKLSLGQIGKRVGYLFQRPEIQLFAPTVLEELTFAETFREKKKNLGFGEKEEEIKDEKEKAMEWLRYFEIDHLWERSTFNLSKGEKQRLALAAIMYSGATYLILDEPTSGLDEKRKQILIDKLKELKSEKGIGIAIISHDDDFINEMADRIIKIKGGAVDLDVSR